MSDSLRDRIERVIEDHTLINGADECTCGVMWEVQDGFRSTDGSTCFDNHLAGAVVAELEAHYWVTPICGNCDGRQCMACVVREWHEVCRHDCPDCQPGQRIRSAEKLGLRGGGE